MTKRVEELLSIITQDDITELLKASDKGLRPKAAAAHLGVSVRCLEEWRRKGVGPKWQRGWGRAILYRLADLDAHREDHDQPLTDEAASD